MKIGTWNVNSIRARLPTVVAVLRELSLDVVCLQEIKCEEMAFPTAAMEELGYQCAVYGQKTFNGVALLSRYGIEDVERGLGDGDPQARYVEALIAAPDPVRVASVYVPNGNPAPGPKYDYKLDFVEKLRARMRERLAFEEAFVLAGDFNCIPGDRDCWDPEVWADDALALPATRQGFRALLHAGWTDAVAAVDADGHRYTFWDYQAGAWNKDHGIRIDHFLLSPQATDRLVSAGVHRDARAMKKPSDHVPVHAVLRERGGDVNEGGG